MLVIVLANYIFFGMLSPTAWAHNYLDSLPLLAIVAGLGLERWINAARAALAGAQGAGRELRWAAGGAGLIVVSLVVLAPLANENWLRGSVYGFGFVPRDELSAVAAALRSASAPGEAVVAPTFLCFEANRPELIRYPETYGIYREAKKLYRSEGFFAARRELGRQDFFDLIARTAHYWADTIDDAVARGKVDAVVLDSRIELLPLVDPPIVKLTPDYLAAHGFTPSLRTEHFVVWVRPRAHGSPGNIRFGMEGRSEHRPFALSSF